MKFNGLAQRVTAGLAIVGLMGGYFGWLNGNFVSASEFKAAQEALTEDITKLQVGQLEAQLRVISGDLYDRRRELKSDPANEPLSRLIEGLVTDRGLLNGRLEALR